MAPSPGPAPDAPARQRESGSQPASPNGRPPSGQRPPPRAPANPRAAPRRRPIGSAAAGPGPAPLRRAGPRGAPSGPGCGGGGGGGGVGRARGGCARGGGEGAASPALLAPAAPPAVPPAPRPAAGARPNLYVTVASSPRDVSRGRDVTRRGVKVMAAPPPCPGLVSFLPAAARPRPGPGHRPGASGSRCRGVTAHPPLGQPRPFALTRPARGCPSPAAGPRCCGAPPVSAGDAGPCQGVPGVSHTAPLSPLSPQPGREGRARCRHRVPGAPSPPSALTQRRGCSRHRLCSACAKRPAPVGMW